VPEWAINVTTSLPSVLRHAWAEDHVANAVPPIYGAVAGQAGLPADRLLHADGLCSRVHCYRHLGAFLVRSREGVHVPRARADLIHFAARRQAAVACSRIAACREDLRLYQRRGERRTLG
jgi:hypothetical protein